MESLDVRRALVTLVAGLVGGFLLLSYRRLKRSKLGGDAHRAAIRVKERDFSHFDGKEADILKCFTRRELVMMTAICDSFLPSFFPEDVDRAVDEFMRAEFGEAIVEPPRNKAYFERGAIEAQVPLEVCRVLEQYLPPDLIVQIRLVLRTLDTRLGVFLLTGVWTLQPFTRLPFRQREQALINMLSSYIAPLRGAALALKGMAGKIYYAATHPNFTGHMAKTKTTHSNGNGKPNGKGDNGQGSKEGEGGEDKAGVNPTWCVLQYEDRTLDTVNKVLKGKPLPPPGLVMAGRDVSAPLPEAVGDPDVREMHADVVIVGSGAGGGVAAAVLATAGFKVVVLERGPYCSEKDFASFTEEDAVAQLYDNGGWIASEELSIQMLAGACVGGGTTINWTASFRTPKHVLHEWVQRFKLTSFQTPLYAEAMDAVCRRGNVNTHHSHRGRHMDGHPDLVVNQNNQMLCEVAETWGTKTLPIPRNVKDCRDCTGCERGCPYGAKQSTLKTFLQDAHDTGNLTIFHKAHVDKVVMEDGRATGVLASIKEEGESRYRLVVHASKAVIASAGSLHTPALLLRSGLKHDKIGRHLALHPVSGVTGVYTHTMGHHKGVGMGTYVPEWMDLDDHGYGAVLETPPSHSGMTAVLIPWSHALSYRVMMSLKEYCAITIPITRDRSSPHNRVFIDSAGRPRIRYQLTTQDEAMLRRMVAIQCRLQEKHGAHYVWPVREQVKPWRRHRQASFEDYLKYVDDLGTPLGNAQLFSAHQMGSCRMAVSPREGVVDEEGQCHEVKGLYIMDASVFPTSLGINPMMTVEAIAFMLAKKLATKLQGDVSAVEARYCVPTPEEASGKVTYPTGPTLHNDYGVPCKDKW